MGRTGDGLGGDGIVVMAEKRPLGAEIGGQEVRVFSSGEKKKQQQRGTGMDA